mmetsp:Transcript_57599/g.91583  ORF Transcript_57599/g.91583 Transcript_57599/m.91583 type:complete len:212 (+) Transcript_57599:95-730(+)
MQPNHILCSLQMIAAQHSALCAVKLSAFRITRNSTSLMHDDFRCRIIPRLGTMYVVPAFKENICSSTRHKTHIHRATAQHTNTSHFLSIQQVTQSAIQTFHPFLTAIISDFRQHHCLLDHIVVIHGNWICLQFDFLLRRMSNQIRSSSQDCMEGLVQNRTVHHTQNRHLVHSESNTDSNIRQTMEEIGGSVDGINEPGKLVGDVMSSGIHT